MHWVRMRIVGLFLGAVLLGAAAGAQQPSAGDASTTGGLLRAMVQFDRAFIPAWVLTTGRDAEAARMAVLGARAAWLDFLSDRRVGAAADNDLKAFFIRVGMRMDEALRLATDGDARAAHRILETVRYEFRGLRQRRGLDYYLDYVIDFDDVAEPLHLIALDKPADCLTAGDVTLIRQYLLPRAVEAHARLAGATPDGALFGLSPERREVVRHLVGEAGAALERLEEAAASGDAARILRAIHALREPYARLYTFFGNMPPRS